MRMDEEWLSEAFEAGADGVLSKSVHPVSMGTLLREISQGHVVQRFRTTRPAVSQEDCPLTDREKEILSAGRRGLHQPADRPRAVGDRADGQVPPLEHLPQARRRQPHRGDPLRLHARPGAAA